MHETIYAPHNVVYEASKFQNKLIFSSFLFLANVQFDLRSSFASSNLPNVASLSRFGSSARSSNLQSHFSILHHQVN